MSAPPDMADRHARVLSRLCELGLALAEDLHARALAAEDPKAAAELGLAFHRIFRSVRQTLALEAKLQRDRKREERAEREAAGPPTPPIRDERRVRQRTAELREAVESLIWEEAKGEDAEALLERFEDRLEAEVDAADFGLEPLDLHIARFCGELRIPGPLPPGLAPSDPAPPAPTRAGDWPQPVPERQSSA